jgi:hypothetical protein
LRDPYLGKLRPTAESRLSLLLLLLAKRIKVILASGERYYSIFGCDWGKLPIKLGVGNLFRLKIGFWERLSALFMLIIKIQ